GRWKQRAGLDPVAAEAVLRHVDRARDRAEARARRAGQSDDAGRARDEALELAPLVDLTAQAARARAVRRLGAPCRLALRVVDQALLDVEHRLVLRLGRPLV